MVVRLSHKINQRADILFAARSINHILIFTFTLLAHGRQTSFIVILHNLTRPEPSLVTSAPLSHCRLPVRHVQHKLDGRYEWYISVLSRRVECRDSTFVPCSSRKSLGRVEGGAPDGKLVAGG